MVHRPKMVTTIPEKIVYAGMYPEKALRLMPGFEPPHLPLSLSGSLVRYLSPIVGVLLGVVHRAR